MVDYIYRLYDSQETRHHLYLWLIIIGVLMLLLVLFFVTFIVSFWLLHTYPIPMFGGLLLIVIGVSIKNRVIS